MGVSRLPITARHCAPTLPNLAPCSPLSRPLRAACGGGLRPVLTAAARDTTLIPGSGRRNGFFGRTKNCTPTLAAAVAALNPPRSYSRADPTWRLTSNASYKPACPWLEQGAAAPALSPWVPAPRLRRDKLRGKDERVVPHRLAASLWRFPDLDDVLGKDHLFAADPRRVAGR